MVPDDISDLIGRVALGDRGAFARLYEATSAKLFGICLRVLKDRTDAEDVLQETYVKIWNNAGRYRTTGYSPITWLVTIARNQAIDRLRARRPETDELAAAEEVADGAATPEQRVLQGGESSKLRQCLEKLAPDRASAVKAAYIEGHSYQELAERMGQPINTIRTWLRRSLASLRECLSS
jgi:RNA polymerase sigma-70 factor (ECF subfamily)